MVDKNNEVTSVSEWKSGASSGTVLPLPSGKKAKVRRISIQTYMKTGRIPNVLMAPLQRALAKGQNEFDDSELSKIFEDPAAISQLFAMVDAIAVDAFVEPQLTPDPAQGQERDENLLYVDEVDIDDKMFVFQWMVGGTSELSEFRTQQDQQLESLSAQSNVAVSSEPVSGDQ